MADALAGSGWHDQDAAAVELARTYARMIDAGEAVKVGPLLLAVLVELGMTPKARAGVVRGGQVGDGDSKRGKLHALRGGLHGAAAVDPSAP